MNLQSRVTRLMKGLGRPAAGPLTLFLRETATERPVGRRVVWDGQGVEIVFDPANGPPQLPPGGPHKIIFGMDPDWV